MAGNHNSGRKSRRDENLRREVVENAWNKKKKRMSEQDATQIVLKDMTVKTDLTSNGNKLDPIVVKVIREKE